MDLKKLASELRVRMQKGDMVKMAEQSGIKYQRFARTFAKSGANENTAYRDCIVFAAKFLESRDEEFKKQIGRAE